MFLSMFFLGVKEKEIAVMLQEFPPIDTPKELFLQYIVIAYEFKFECDKDISLFENLQTSWELDTIK